MFDLQSMDDRARHFSVAFTSLEAYRDLSGWEAGEMYQLAPAPFDVRCGNVWLDGVLQRKAER